MGYIPEIRPISELRTEHKAVLNLIKDDCEVVLTQHGKRVAVLVSPKKWNQIGNELEYLRDSLAAMEARRDMKSTVDFDEYVTKRPLVKPD